MLTRFLALHMPDGFLTPAVALVGWLLTIAVVTLALRNTKKSLNERQVPVLGVMAAFIFAAQAINFPVTAGTSGHLLGGALAAILLGPWAASLIMTVVIGIQGLLFQDGGLIVMGWNIFNMGVITAFTGYAAYKAVIGILGDRVGAALSGAFFGAWASVVVGAMATAIELAISGTIPLRVVLPGMVLIHLFIGIGEALITIGAVSLIRSIRPEILSVGQEISGRRGMYVVIAGSLVALLLAAISPFASADPDGLESVAAQSGFLQQGEKPIYELIPGYVLPLVQSEALATFLAVAVGAVLVFVLSVVIGKRAAQT